MSEGMDACIHAFSVGPSFCPGHMFRLDAMPGKANNSD